MRHVLISTIITLFSDVVIYEYVIAVVSCRFLSFCRCRSRRFPVFSLSFINSTSASLFPFQLLAPPFCCVFCFVPFFNAYIIIVILIRRSTVAKAVMNMPNSRLQRVKSGISVEKKIKFSIYTVLIKCRQRYSFYIYCLTVCKRVVLSINTFPPRPAL